MRFFVWSKMKAVIFLAVWMSVTSSVSFSAEELDECIAMSDGNCLSSSDIQSNFDLATPENPLFALMNASPETVIRPKVGDKLMVSYLPLVADTFGKDSYSIGLELNPGQLYQPQIFTAGELMGVESGWDGTTERIKRLRRSKTLSRFLISAAASESLADTISLNRFGFGLAYTLDTGSNWETTEEYGSCIREKGALDVGRAIAKLQKDELQNNANKYANSADKAGDALKEIKNSDIYKETVSKQIASITHMCAKGVSPWNRNVFGIGLAAYHGQSTDAEDNKESESGYGLWITLVKKVGRNGQLSLGARINDGYLQPLDDAVVEVDDGVRFGVRYAHQMLGISDADRAFRGFIEIGSVSEKIDNMDDEYTQASLGFEVQVSRDLYFQAAIGDTFESEADRERHLSGKFKWSFTSKTVK
ncbi:hypothetical protein [Granulosicoccus antarcticus]|uniref:Autotransporter domain-containing protein n=1 Tax=Granulosicoccus antarcticus IMCC3135 TaxID=1192854 RepID=A0A2Z2NNK1_9GAMM|nr:hypothetical protein [Granulosicoccus antarcticus]ASJ72105.1 hypothetical protein IMCC3135_10055 [Granulosicoccus antarcticus IMCC3135]